MGCLIMVKLDCTHQIVWKSGEFGNLNYNCKIDNVRTNLDCELIVCSKAMFLLDQSSTIIVYYM